MIAEAVGSMYRTRGLLREWTSRTLRGRYQQSVLGWLWAVIQPAVQAVMFAFIFTWVIPVQTGATPYVVFAYLATVPWAFLSASLTDMTNALVDNMNLVNKIYFPREALPVASMLARLVDFAVAALFFVVLALWYRVPAVSPLLVYLPLVLGIQVLLVLGLGLACAAMNVFVRDVRTVLVLLLQVWFYLSPVIYPLDAVPARFRPFLVINPMVGIIEGYRAVLLESRPPDGSLVVAAVVSCVLFVAGYAFFKRVEFKFADIV